MSKSVSFFNKKDKSLLVDNDVYELIHKERVFFYFIRTSPTVKILFHETKSLINVNKLLFSYDHTRYYIHHKNNDFFDKRRSNLCIKLKAEKTRMQNTSMFKGNLYKGVSFDTNYNKFKSYICMNNKTIMLGLHDTPEDGARLYDSVIYKLFGVNAYINFSAQVNSVLPLEVEERLKKENIHLCHVN